MATKHTDEIRCKLCKGVYPNESDQIIEVWTQEHQGDRLATKFLGYFCEFCIPGSAYLDKKQLVYVVDRLG